MNNQTLNDYYEAALLFDDNINCLVDFIKIKKLSKLKKCMIVERLEKINLNALNNPFEKILEDFTRKEILDFVYNWKIKKVNKQTTLLSFMED